MKSVKAIFIDSNSYKQIGEWGGVSLLTSPDDFNVKHPTSIRLIHRAPWAGSRGAFVAIKGVCL